MIVALLTAFALGQTPAEPAPAEDAESEPVVAPAAPTDPGDAPADTGAAPEPDPAAPASEPAPPAPAPEPTGGPAPQPDPVAPGVDPVAAEPPDDPAELEPRISEPPAMVAPTVTAPIARPTPLPQGPPTDDSEAVVIERPVERPLDRRVEAVFDQLVPSLGRRGPQALFGLSLLALIGLVAAGAARSFRDRLRPTGILPSLMVGVEIFGRAIAVVVGVTILVALLPVGIVPALTWIAIGAALAVGWSLREILPDVLAWVVLATEGQLVRGAWVRTGDLHGSIDSFTLRSVWIRDVHGQRVSIPNRLLLQQPIQAAADAFPKTHLTLSLPDVDPAVARQVVREATMLSPWLAPSTQPEVGQDPLDPTRWTVAVQLLDGTFENDFAGSFPERVREVLAQRAGKMPPPGE